MRSAISSFARSSRARSSRANHRSRRFISRHPAWLVALLLTAALLAAAIGGPITSAAPTTFTAKLDFAAGDGPISVTEADLNGDGSLDLAFANENSNTVSVMLNTTAPGAVTPSLAAPQPFATGSGPVSVIVGDLNRDGMLDLAVLNRSVDTVSVLLNTTAPGAATPSFAAQQTFATGSGAQSLTVGDLNGDGNLDLAVANSADNTVSVLLNTTTPGAATPSFAAQQTFATGSGAQSVTVGDFNGDGRLDLAVTNASFGVNTVSVLLNITAPGAVTLGFAAKQDFATGNTPVSVTVEDLNLDGRSDLAVANYVDHTVSVLLNTTAPGAATPSFAAKQDFAATNSPAFVRVGDLDLDGRPDLAIANFNGDTVSVLLNTTAPGAATPSFAAKQDFTTGFGPLSVAVGDLNGDGRPDLAAANFNADSMSVLLNTTTVGAATARLAAQQAFATGAVPTFVTAGDLNGDGKLDLAVANNGSNTVSALRNTTAPGAATPTFAVQQTFAAGSGSQSVTMGDLNGDGRLDLAVANSNVNTVSVLLNTTAPGAATFSFALQQTFATGSGPVSVTVGDLNLDGRPDLAVANNSGNTVSVLLNTTAPGALIPSFAAKQDFATGTVPGSVAVGDLNLDGKLDLAVANLTGNTVSVLLNTTAAGAAIPTFATQQIFAAGFNPSAVTVGDLNGDGRLDLAVANFGSDTVSVLLNTTAPGAAIPSFAAQQTFATGSGAQSVTVGDLNGDGRLDLAVANINADTVSVLLNNTAPGAVTPTLTAKQDFATGSSPGFVTVGDLNLDGKLDLALANESDNSVSVLLNTMGLPTIVAATGLSRPQGSAASNSQIATVTDDGGNGSVIVTITSANPSTGVTISNIVNTGGNITADIVADCTATNATFTLQASNGTSTATATLTINVTASATPTITPGGPTTFCAGGSVTLTSSSASGNQWYLNGNPIGGATNQSYVATASGDYTVTANSCTGTPSAATSVTVNPIPATPTITPGGPTTFCTGGSVTLTSSSASGNQWFLNGNPIGGATNQAFIATAAGNYTDTVTASGCTSTPSTATTVTVNPIPATPTITPGGPTTFCTGGSVTLTSSSASGNQWFLNGNPIGGATNQAFIATAAGNYTDTVTASGCTSSPSTATSVTVNPIPATPTITPGGPTTFCTGGGVALTSSSASGNQWYLNGNPIGGATNQAYNATAAGNYTVTVTASGCTSAASAATTVTADTPPTLTYGNQAVPLNGALSINPATGPADNLTVSSIVVRSLGTYTGTISVDNTSGVVSVSSAAPAGVHTITIRATDNCGATTDASFTLSVSNRPLISLSNTNYNVNENTGFVTITVNRTGDLSIPVTVDYATDDTGASDICSTLNSGLAAARCGFSLTLGTLSFAATETQKTFLITIDQDSYSEGPELFTVNLSNLTGSGAAFASPSSATVTISDSAAPAPNANDDPSTFVREQYHDFLNREPDAAGLAFWTNEITSCGSDVACRDVKRINVSAAFFLSIEFQATGNLVRSFYVAALNRPGTNNMPAFTEFERDTQAMQRGVIVDPNNNDWQTVLNNNRDAFMRDFATRAEFVVLYPTTDTPAQYVDKLYQHAGITPTSSERSNTIAEFGSDPTAAEAGARGRALLDVTQNTTFQQREINRSFVQMEYFGYLRRNPNDSPDGNFAGYDFWLTKLNAANGNFVDAEMVKAFITSDEYRRRFGP